MTHIHIQNAALAYRSTAIFSHVNMVLPAGKWVALLGPSGVGKTSLLRMIARLTTPHEHHEGVIYADNHIPVHEQVAYMAQTDLLLPWLTVLDNTLLGLKLRKHSRKEYSAHREKALLLLNKVGLGKASQLYPKQLSGGMRQRAALVRTLMEEKPIVLMDEPFSALDAITRYKLQELAVELLQEKTVLFITHDPMEALRLAHEIYLLHGQPASLKSIASLTSVIPRELSHEELQLQTHLFKELAKASEAISCA